MKVINPNTVGTHEIKLIPRFEGYQDISLLTLSLYNESIREFSDVTISDYYELNGVYTLEFSINNYTILENDTFEIKLLDNQDSNVLYKGKILATSQTPQNYKLTDGLYTYN
tara:strand:- start:444 stop:779 length:336 start_codon:yes stop_codon:yes gene_type:complete